MLKQAMRVMVVLAVLGAFAPAVATAQDPNPIPPPIPGNQDQAAPATEAPATEAPAMQVPPTQMPGQMENMTPAGLPMSGWDAYLHDPYNGSPQRPYGSATTTYYPWPGMPYYGPRYYGFRPGWFGAGYPTSDFAGFWW